MTETYKSVAEMINHLSTDEAFKNLSKKEIFGRQLSKFLFFLRCQHGLSQKDMAEKMHCSQSRVSKIESSIDANISVKDLLNYADALKLQLEIGYRNPSWKIVDKIKFHAFQMKENLDKLCELAKDDPAIEAAVRKFYGEAFINVMSLISESYSKLQIKKDKEQKAPIHIMPPMEEPTETANNI